MKKINIKKMSLAGVALFALAFGVFAPQISLAYSCSGYGCNYNYDNYGQYYISPLMTSTQPYPVGGYPVYPPNYPNYSNNNNYYGYNNNYNYNYSQLYVSCSVNKSSANRGEPVTWNAYVSGGSSGYNTYLWRGTDNPQSLNLSSINVTYQNPGLKTMSVTVTTPYGQTQTAYCGQATVFNYYNYNPYVYGQYPYAY